MSPASLIAGIPTPHTLALSFANVPVRVQTNDADVHARLASYYRPYVVTDGPAPLADVRLIHGDVPVEGDFVDLPRRGRRPKEAILDVPGGRLIRKRSTGALMGLWAGGGFAAGDLRANLNQAINLVNNCYATAILRRGHVLLHASAVTRDQRTAALAGPPGAGKSTSALHLVEAGFRCLSNDRVLAKPLPEGVEALGYPKQPRVNPGTLLGHSRLATLLAPADRASLTALPAGELWELERKSDVDLDAIYGDGTVDLRGRMVALVLLRWQRDGQGFVVRRLSVEEALEALPLVYKNLGAFDLDRPPLLPMTDAERERYRALFERVTLVEVTGRTEFSALVKTVDHLLSA
jgi:HprK-related kinase B